MLTKLNVIGIVTDHFRTLRAYNSRSNSWGEIGLLYGVPALAAIVMLVFGFTVSDETANILITSLSVFAALLLNLLLMLFDSLSKVQQGNAEQVEKARKELIRETYANISYSILVALACISILIGFAIWDLGINNLAITLLKQIASGLVYFLVLNFLLTLFMVLKRIHVLLSRELDHRKP